MQKINAIVQNIRDNHIIYNRKNDTGLLGLGYLKKEYILPFESNPGFDVGDEIQITAEKVTQ